MPSQKSDIIKQLESEILALQGYNTSLGSLPVNIDLGPINDAFPNSIFPVGAIHEFTSSDLERQVAASGFIAAIIAALMQDNGVTLWISTARTMFPPALKRFGIDPHKVIFIDLKNEKQVAWAINEALQVKGLAAVVGEMQDLDFTASRRFQLAVEETKVTGFLFNRKNAAAANACLTRWKISSLPSLSEEELPGIGFPAWKVELLKVRNGKPGTWELAYMNGRLNVLSKALVDGSVYHKKTG